MKTVLKAVTPLKQQNPCFEFHHVEGKELVIETDRGKYALKPDEKNQVLILQSYFSGFHNYYYDIQDKLWVSTQDKHDLRGLLTRDIMRHWNGVPEFP